MKAGNKILFVICAVAAVAGVIIYLEASSFQKTAKITQGVVTSSSMSSYEIRFNSEDGVERIIGAPTAARANATTMVNRLRYSIRLIILINRVSQMVLREERKSCSGPSYCSCLTCFQFTLAGRKTKARIISKHRDERLRHRYWGLISIPHSL